MYRLARRSLIAARDIPAGTVITREHLVVKRPGYGIAPKHIDRVIGRVARVDIEADDILTWEHGLRRCESRCSGRARSAAATPRSSLALGHEADGL